MKQAVILEAEQYDSLMDRLAKCESEINAIKSQPLSLDWVTVEQAAALLYRCKATVKRMCKDGDLEYKQDKRKIEVRLRSIIDYNEKRGIKNV
jgi:hypothetical protein